MSELPPEDEENRPITPHRPKHVPFWPVAIGLAFMIAVVISGIIASNHARKENIAVTTSTLPAKGAPKPTTSTTVASKSGKSTTSVSEPTTLTPSSLTPSPESQACSADNMVKAALASGQVDQNTLGTISAPQFKCVSGYALARLVPSKANQQSVTADYQLQANKTWKMLNLGDVDPTADGVPQNIAAQLVLN